MTTAEADDPYSDPDTGVLFNLLGITDQDELAHAEADVAGARLSGLGLAPIRPSGDVDEFCGIHR